MRLKLKLYATLSDYLPSGAVDNSANIEVAEGATPSSIIDRYRIPPAQAHLVLINGVYCGAAERRSHALRDGDTLAIWPPVAGG